MNLFVGAAPMIQGLTLKWSVPRPSGPTDTLRRVKRLTWFALVACIVLVGSIGGEPALAQQLSVRLALVVILVASWAIVAQVAVYIRADEARRLADSEAARLEGARLTASAMQDRIANKLSLTVGYTEFLVTDPRVPADLREQAQKAMDGARAAAETVSELKRLTRLQHQLTTHATTNAEQLLEMVVRAEAPPGA